MTYSPGILGTASIGEISVRGFTEPYTVTWSSGCLSATPLPATLGPHNDIVPATYKISITDADSVTVAKEIDVPQGLQTCKVPAFLNSPVSLAVDGDWCAQGTMSFNGNVGAVQLFYNMSTTAVPKFTYTETLIGNAAGVQFGSAVSLSGNTLVVGAQTGQTASVYIQSGSNWVLQQSLVAADPTASDGFGNTVAVVGDVIAVGAGGWDQKTPTAVSNCGAIYIFTRSGTTWTQQQRFTRTTPVASDALAASGMSMSFTGANGTIVASTAALSAVVFVSSDAGVTWTEQQVLTPSVVVAGNGFGLQVHTRGDSLAVTAATEASSAGAIYYFTRSAGTWSQQARLTAPNALPNDSLQRGTIIAPGIIAGVATGTELSLPHMVSSASAIHTFTFVDNAWTTKAHPVRTAYPFYPGGNNITLMHSDGTTVAAGSAFPGVCCYNAGQLPLTLLPGTVQHVSVYGHANASIGRTNATGGAGPYSYSWSSSGPGASTITQQNSDAKSFIKAGQYTVTVTDSAAATASFTYTIAEPAAETAPAGGGGGGGSIGPQGIQGPPGIQGPKGDRGEAGPSSGRAVITGLITSGGAVTPVPASRRTGGAISSVSVSNGTEPYAVSWEGPDEYTFADFDAQRDLVVGKYVATITDAVGASLTRSFNVGREAPRSLNSR